jgi:HK97 family phage major capsid protein
MDQILQAKAQLEVAEFEATGVIMNPVDVARAMSSKDGEDRYLSGGPFASTPPTIWGCPIVASNSMTVDKALIGDFKRQVLYTRQDVTVEISTEDSDNFRKNLVTIRAEERVALSVQVPEALVYLDLGNVT